MDQAVTAVLAEYRGALILALAACTSLAMARPAAEPPVRPVGIVEQPCPAPTVPTGDTEKPVKDWHERILDPSEGREFEPPEPSTLNSLHTAEEEHLHTDWASLCRYRAENAALRRATVP